MENEIVYQTVGAFVKASSTTLDYLLEKFVQSSAQVVNSINKITEKPYHDILSEGGLNDLSFIRSVCSQHYKLSKAFSLNGIYKDIYISSQADVAKARETLAEATADFTNFGGVSETFEKMTPNNMTKAEALELTPNEYEFISKTYYTLSSLFDELSKNREVIVTTLKNLDYLYQEISSSF